MDRDAAKFYSNSASSSTNVSAMPSRISIYIFLALFLLAVSRRLIPFDAVCLIYGDN